MPLTDEERGAAAVGIWLVAILLFIAGLALWDWFK